MRILAAVVFALATGVGDAHSPLATFARLPLDTYGDSIRTITSKLRRPVAANFELVPNRHDPTMRDVRATLTFEGVEAVVIIALCCDKSLLESFRVDASAAVSVIGEALPATPEQIESRFGAPSERSADEFVYEVDNETGADTVTFAIAHGRVLHAEWRYFID